MTGADGQTTGQVPGHATEHAARHAAGPHVGSVAAPAAAIDHVERLEIALLDPAVRADPEQLDRLLHPDFVEHGASGRVWTRQAVIDELPFEDGSTPRTTASAVSGRHVADGAILVTYRTTTDAQPPKTAVRSSLWLQAPDGRWQIRFHQGTLTTG